MIDFDFAGITNGSANPSNLKFNVWEPCNGVGTCNLPYCYYYYGGSTYCYPPSSPCNCPNNFLGNNGPGQRCENTVQQSMYTYSENGYYNNWNTVTYANIPSDATNVHAVRTAGGFPSYFSTPSTRTTEYLLPAWSSSLSSWNGMLADNTSVFSPDRMSGALSPTPPLFTDVGEGAVGGIPGFWAQVTNAV